MKPTHVFSPNRALTLPIADISGITFERHWINDVDGERARAEAKEAGEDVPDPPNHVIAHVDPQRTRWFYLQDTLPPGCVVKAVEYWSRAIFEAPDGDSAVLRVEPYVPPAKSDDGDQGDKGDE